MIRIADVHKSFNGFRALKGITLDIKSGEKFILLGTSGSGKTTLLKMINRIIEPTSGEIFYNDNDIKREDKISLRRKMGYVIQDVGLFPHYTVAQNISLIPHLLNWTAEKIIERTSYLLNLLHLDQSFLNRYPDELSGGQKQRIGIARALAANPGLILMDEPFGALDPITRQGIRKEFSELPELKDKTVVMVTHDVQEALETGDRICLLDSGEIRQVGNPKEILFKPTSKFVADFFGENRISFEMSVVQVSELDTSLNYPNTTLQDFLNSKTDTHEKELAVRMFYQWRSKNYPDAP